MIVKHNSPFGAAATRYPWVQAYRDGLAHGPDVGFRRHHRPQSRRGPGRPPRRSCRHQKRMASWNAFSHPATTRLRSRGAVAKERPAPFGGSRIGADRPLTFRQVTGACLLQTPDAGGEPAELKVVTERARAGELGLCVSPGWCAKHTKSNAI